MLNFSKLLFPHSNFPPNLLFPYKKEAVEKVFSLKSEVFCKYICKNWKIGVTSQWFSYI